MDAYLAAAGIAAQRKGHLLRSAKGKPRTLPDRPMDENDALRVIGFELASRRSANGCRRIGGAGRTATSEELSGPLDATGSIVSAGAHSPGRDSLSLTPSQALPSLSAGT
jgi:hypothetical protein